MNNFKNIAKILVVQRSSLSNYIFLSRSIGARFIPLLNYMSSNRLLDYSHITEDDITVRELNNFDTVLFNKHTSSKAINIMKLANQLGKRTIYDLDDWILDLPEYSVTDLNEDHISNIVWMIRNATFVTVSNRILLDKISVIRSSVIVLKNSIDTNIFPSFIDGWRESINPKIIFSNTDGIKLINFKTQFIDLLSNFLNLNKEVSIDYWGDVFPEIYKIPRINLRGFMDNDLYKRAILKEGYWFSIVPLGGEEDPGTLLFNSCKSCIKYIDYGALGIPGIYSNALVYSEIIKNKINGIVVNNDQISWERALTELLNKSSLRNNIRKRAYIDVVKNHGVQESAKIFLQLIY